MMRYVVSYDIADDRLRGRIARILDDYGDRVQRSVFEADLETATLGAMIGRLKREELGAADSIRIYALCASCAGKGIRLGSNRELDTRDAIVV